MVSVKYEHCSMYGSYLIDCEILQMLSDNKYRIKYHCPVLEQETLEDVDKSYLHWPSFSDLVI